MPGPTTREDVSVDELMRRGWTLGMVATLLGPPGTIAPNPYFPTWSAFADAQAKSFRSTRPRAGQGDGAAAPFP